jgi:hypothetical protein
MLPATRQPLQGRAEPVPLVLKAGRQGVGAAEAAAARKREAEWRAAEAGARGAGPGGLHMGLQGDGAGNAARGKARLNTYALHCRRRAATRPPPASCTTAAKRQRRAAVAQEGFKGAQAGAYALRRLRGHVAAAEAACRSLDERAGIEANPLLPPLAPQGGGCGVGVGGGGGAAREEAAAPLRGGRSGLGPAPGWGDEGEEGEEAEQAAAAAAEAEAGPPPVEGLGPEEARARLADLVGYLRSRYHYCVFCSVAYDDGGDMQRHCPGPSEEEHE